MKLRASDRQVMRFIGVGALNSLFGFAAFSALCLLGAANWVSVLGGNLAGLAFNYLTHSTLVFRDLALARLPRFAVAYGAVFALNTGLLEWLGPLIGNTILTQACLTLPLAVLAYLLMSRWVFHKTAAS